MALRLLGIERRFGAHTALAGVNLHVRRGDVYGFVGHNGAGKTTAMRIALGLMRPDAGRVVVDGFDAAAHPTEARARLSGLIETPGFHDHLSGRRNLLLLARLGGASRAEARRDADRVLEEVGLTEAAGRAVGGYSQGMRQRLGIAQALLGEPRYVLLDEPTNGLDPEGLESMRRLLTRLNQDLGVTLLVSSHALHELSGLCNRIGIVKRGRLLVEERTDVLLGAETRRVELVCDAPERAVEILGADGHAVEREGDALLVATDEPSAVLARLVAEGVAVERFARRRPDLEEVYFRWSDADAPAVAADDAQDEARAERVAPGWGTLRNARYELSRWCSSWVVPTALVLPSLLAAGAVWMRRREEVAHQEQMAAGEIFSSTSVTAFEGVGVALQAGLLPLALVLATIASQSLAGERSRGTLRNVLLRPARRSQVALGKVLALLTATLTGFGLLLATAAGLSGLWFDFGPVVEILPNGEPFELIPAEELWPHLRSVLVEPLPAVGCYAALGFFAGALVRSGVAGLGLAFGLSVMLEIGRVPARAFATEEWLPSAYLPSPLSDTSVVQTFLGHARGVANAAEAVADDAFTVPLVWTVVALLLGIWLLGRRSVS